MQEVCKASIIECPKCHSTLAEHYGYFVLVKHKGRVIRMYGPGLVVLDCPNPRCGISTPVQVETKRT